MELNMREFLRIACVQLAEEIRWGYHGCPKRTAELKSIHDAQEPIAIPDDD